MSARTFHFVRNANASVVTALCGVGINTKRDSNWSDDISGVSCKKCIAKFRKEAEQLEATIQSESAKAPKVKKVKVKKEKHAVDKKAVKSLKKLRKQSEKLLARVVASAPHVDVTEHGVRCKHASELLDVVEAMLAREREGWLAR